jgi:hypothetical protein
MIVNESTIFPREVAVRVISACFEQTSAADGTYWISRIPRLILILRDEADLPFGERLDPLAVQGERADHQTVTQQRHAEHRA